MASLISGSWRITGGTWFNARAVFLGCATEYAVSGCHIVMNMQTLYCPTVLDSSI